MPKALVPVRDEGSRGATLLPRDVAAARSYRPRALAHRVRRAAARWGRPPG